VYHSTSWKLIFDIYIPNINTVLEYQGEHHYYEIHAKGPHELHELKDEEKILICKERNIMLIHIPYWLQRSVHALCEVITPNLMLHYGEK
jgi:hypothetical protein